MDSTAASDEQPRRPWSAATTRPDMWVDADQDPRQGGPDPVDERTTLLDFLNGYRLTLEMKCGDLNPEQLAARSVPPSTMSLLGLIRHMAEVERYWFRQVMAGGTPEPRYRTPGDRDACWNDAAGEAPLVAQAWDAWREEVDFSDRWVGGTDDLAALGTQRDGTPIPLRAVLVHMIEEYARHCGHADLLRERIDGRIGQ
ncbi:MAG: DinB family protein [Candidatus Dormibacteria bacterium]